MAKIQIKNSFITSSAQITISSSLVSFSGGISAKNFTGSFSGSIPQLSSYFKQGGNSFGTTATLGTNDNQMVVKELELTHQAIYWLEPQHLLVIPDYLLVLLEPLVKFLVACKTQVGVYVNEM